MTEETKIDGEADHLDSVQVAAYAEGRLEGEALRAVEAHLAECPECRAEASHVALFLGDRSTRRWWWIGVPAVAAAAAIFLLLPVGDAGPDAGPRFRPGPDADREALPRVEVVVPTEGATMAADSVRFVWRSEGPDVTYHITLTDEGGSILWETNTADTALVLPPRIRPEAGLRYLWYVDAALPDGGIATTGVHEVRVRR